MGGRLKAAAAKLTRRGRPPAAAPPPPPLHDWSVRDTAAGVPTQPVSARLLERLRPEDVAAIEASMDPGAAAAYAEATDEIRPYFQLYAGVYAQIPAVLERTGLTPDEPPEHIHAMARGPWSTGGDHYSADLVGEALARAGGDMASLLRALDFGCSSGRTLRPLAAAYPEVEWHGVDPNGPAVAWAAEHVRGATVTRSPTDPPLAFPDGHFGLVYAISIWSHFAEAAALRWLDEMHRLIVAGGHLVLTLHGAESVAYYGRTGERPPEQLDAIIKALHRHGFWYAAEFGDEGDHGVAHSDWGTAFMSAEWLLRNVTPRWHVVSYQVGRNADNQDVAVLRRC